MKRSYRLTQVVKSNEAEIIKERLLKAEGVMQITFSDDLEVIEVEAEDEFFSQVMSEAVNIFSRVSAGCKIQYIFRHCA